VHPYQRVKQSIELLGTVGIEIYNSFHYILRHCSQIDTTVLYFYVISLLFYVLILRINAFLDTYLLIYLLKIGF